jgi:hypothetical protein
VALTMSTKYKEKIELNKMLRNLKWFFGEKKTTLCCYLR